MIRRYDESQPPEDAPIGNVERPSAPQEVSGPKYIRPTASRGPDGHAERASFKNSFQPFTPSGRSFGSLVRTRSPMCWHSNLYSSPKTHRSRLPKSSQMPSSNPTLHPARRSRYPRVPRNSPRTKPSCHRIPNSLRHRPDRVQRASPHLRLVPSARPLPMTILREPGKYKMGHPKAAPVWRRRYNPLPIHWGPVGQS